MSTPLSWKACAAGLIAGMLMLGCGGSQQVELPPPAPQQPSATELMQKELGDLRAENSTLKGKSADCDRDLQIATVKAFNAERALAALRDSLASIPIVVPKMKTGGGGGGSAAVGVNTDAYQRALGLFRSRTYGEAADIFQSLLNDGAPAMLEDNCHYWLGECLYALKRYHEAIDQFQKIFGYRISEKKDESQVMIAQSYIGMGEKVKAKEEFQRLLDRFPASPYMKFARNQLARL